MRDALAKYMVEEPERFKLVHVLSEEPKEDVGAPVSSHLIRIGISVQNNQTLCLLAVRRGQIEQGHYGGTLLPGGRGSRDTLVRTTWSG